MRAALLFDRCPWGVIAQDPVATGILRVRTMIRRFNKWPPGRDDPRVLEGLTICVDEDDRADDDRTATQ